MENGPALLEILKASGKQWLVVHGHQHLPNLSYFEGGATAPIVFSAGSVAAPTTVVRAKRPRNQLYCIEFESAKTEGIELCGRVRALDWFPHIGWQRAHKDSGLPHSCGFGHRGSLATLAGQVLLHVQNAMSGQTRWPQIVTAIPDISYLIPEDIYALVDLLESQGALVDFDRCGMPSLVGMRRIQNAQSVSI